MKIGVFSGTFDPVHIGHLSIAQQALETGLDKIVFMPEPEPRNKSPLTELSNRVDMLNLAIADNPKFDLFVIEDHKNHTIAETWNFLHKKYGEDSEFSLIMGGDVFEKVIYWDSSLDNLKKTKFIVGLRGEDDGETAIKLKNDYGFDVILLTSKIPSVSSSAIRKSISSGEDVEGIDKSVKEYINGRKLYQG
jgi:nicotinate-nucleotide adenylyltransferase